MLRQDCYTGGDHYWIRYNDGVYEVRKETPDCYEDNETVYSGSYSECSNYIEQLKVKNYEYDFMPWL